MPRVGGRSSSQRNDMAPDKTFVHPLIINGEAVTSGKSFPVTNPSTGEVIWHSSTATFSDVDAAIAAASAALPGWKSTRLTHRRDLILKAAEELQANREAIAEAMKLETAADDGWCGFNIDNAIQMLKGVAARVCSLEGRLPDSDDPSLTAMIVREPYGVVLAIAPWCVVAGHWSARVTD
jgi:acyl-CoA reductase-like NAD-dependent aldehyde dehydrogenase